MNITDTHAHLTSPELLPHVDALLQRAHLASVKRIINICTDEESLAAGLALAARTLAETRLFNAAATTPHDVAAEGNSFFPLVERAASQGLLIAIGETGLDYFYEHSPRALQQEFLIRYFALAKQYKLPLIIHCRDAFADLFTLADQHYPKSPLLMHCFTGNREEAEECVKRGWKISLSGIITYKKSDELRNAARIIPLDALVVETDAPFLAPQSKRGRENEPAFIIETLETLAALKELPLAEMARITSDNASQFFRFES